MVGGFESMTRSATPEEIRKAIESGYPVQFEGQSRPILKGAAK